MLDISCFIVFFFLCLGKGNPYLEQRPVTLANKNQNSLYFSNGKLPLTKTEISTQSLLKHAKIMEVTVVWGGAHPKDHNSIVLTERNVIFQFFPKPLWEFLAAPSMKAWVCLVVVQWFAA